MSATGAAAEAILHYSICPVFVASHVALELGWLDEELASVGVTPRYLGMLDTTAQVIAHNNHQLPWQVRDGGNIPPVWARSRGADTVLVAATFYDSGGQILVRADAGIHRVADLAGRRFGLCRFTGPHRPDWWRANAEYGLFLALRLAGLEPDAVERVDIA